MSAAHSTSRMSRPLAVTLALAAVVALVASLWLFVIAPLFGGASSSAQEIEIEVDVTTSPEPETVITAEPLPGEPEAVPTDLGALPLTTYEVFLSRDPFQPVRLDQDSADDGTGGGDGGIGDTGDGSGDADAGGGGSGDDGTGDDGTGDGDSPPPPGDGCTGSDEVICDGHVVTLVDITSQDGQTAAVVQVDTTLYTVTEGDTFAESFAVLSIDEPCATFLYGDDAFTLCEGDHVLK